MVEPFIIDEIVRKDKEDGRVPLRVPLPVPPFPYDVPNLPPNIDDSGDRGYEIVDSDDNGPKDITPDGINPIEFSSVYKI